MTVGEETTLEQRKERLDSLRAGRELRRGRMISLAVAVGVVLAAASFLYVAKLADRAGGAGFAPSGGTQNYSNDTYVSIPVSEAGATAKFYTYDANGTAVRFFLVKGSDGKQHVAADACDVCYPVHKGYVQTGKNMRCNNCGRLFAINDIGTKNTAGGCWPSRLPMNVEGGQVHLARADLNEKSYLFK